MQFSLRHIFVVVSLSCVWLALMMRGQALFAAFVPILLGMWLLSKERTHTVWLGLVVLYGGVLVTIVCKLITR